MLPFATGALVSPREKLRAALEVVVARGPAEGDVSIGAFLRRRVGDAVVDRLAGPLIGGVYGAGIDELSLLALVPRLREAEQRHGSLVRAGLAARRHATSPSAGVTLVTPLHGMGAVVDALVARLAGADVRLRTRAARLDGEGAAYVLTLDDGSRIVADAVVLAAPAPEAARLLEDVSPRASDALRTFTYRGTAAVSLGDDARQLARPARGHGFVVPDGALAMAACTWTAEKWPGRAPDGALLVRATVRDDAVLAQGDDALIARAHADTAGAMGIAGAPVMARVARWMAAMPRYTVGHLGRLAAAEAGLAGHERIVLAGAAYRGSGVPDCMAQGVAAAERVLSVAREVAA